MLKISPPIGNIWNQITHTRVTFDKSASRVNVTGQSILLGLRYFNLSADLSNMVNGIHGIMY
jgi:hypothetical protein